MRVSTYIIGSSLLTALSLCPASGLLAQSEPSRSPLPDKHIQGVSTCASSNCHGRAQPLAPNADGTSVLQNEFVTWFRHDRHAQAFSVLENAQANRIAHNLGIADPKTDVNCLNCHTTYVPDVAAAGPKYRKEDGVTCESCHGAAEAWLPRHAEKGVTHADNVSRGMVDLARISDRVKVCSNCHLGSEDQSVSHRIMGAGHPRLTFEIDTFESVMPRHWRVDVEPSAAREKSPAQYSSAHTWLVGQVVQASERLQLLAHTSENRHGIFPEFTNFACASCHHRLSDKEFLQRDYGASTGIPRLNTPELFLLVPTLKVLDPVKAKTLDAYLQRLHASYGTSSGAKDIRVISQYVDKELLPFVEGTTLTEENIQKLFKLLNNYTQPNLQYETAEQAAMGASALAAATKDKALARELKPLYEKLKDPDLFRKISPK